VGRKALKRERKEARKDARKTRKAYSSAVAEVRAEREQYAPKGVFLGDLPTDLSAAERKYAAVRARTRLQQATLTKSAKRAARSAPSRQEVLNKAAADWHQASAVISAPPVVTKQLSGPERNIVAAWEAERDATRDPATRDRLDIQIARLLGLIPAGGL
jgi:hypothetical protein